MDEIKKYIRDMINRIVNSKSFINVMQFIRNNVTKTDIFMGSVFVGGFFIHPTIWGCHYLVPKVCGMYFLGKGCLLTMKNCCPSVYEDILDNHSSIISRICQTIVPADYLNCYSVIRSLFEPYLSEFKDISSLSFLHGIYKAATTQKPISISKDRVTKDQLQFLEQACIYSELATGIYGPTMIYGLLREVDDLTDVKHLITGKKDKEGYKQAFLDHCHLQPEDLLYINWGCEDSDEQTVVNTSNGLSLTAPPYFLIRHEATKSIVLCIRGTWNIKDYIVDFKCEGIGWGSGKAHEGIALIANLLLQDTELNRCITQAMKENPDWRVVTVGHSLGAGIAALVTLKWHYNKMYNEPICFAIAPPPCLSSNVWDKGIGYIYSFVNEDDVVPRLCKDGMMGIIRSIISNCSSNSFTKWFTSSTKPKKEESTLMKNPNVIQLYLPGSVYYLHPCINNYEKYEETKRSFNKKELPLMDRIKMLHDKVPGKPGISLFVKGSDFPATIILSPMLLIHHFAFNYEDMLKNVYNAVKQETEKKEY